MTNALHALLRLLAPLCLAATFSTASAAPPAKSAEDRYIAARDAAIAKISALYETGHSDEAARKAEEAATADLGAQMRAILNETAREGFGPAKLSVDTFAKGDEGFGKLDGLRFDALTGRNGEKAGQDGADGKHVEPKAHIVVTTQTLFERWLRAHKDWWDKGARNVPQQVGAALKDENFYTQAVASGAAVVGFNALPVAKPEGVSFAYAVLAGRTQSEIPDAADHLFVSAISGGKVYVAYGTVEPKVQVNACLPLRADFSDKAEKAYKRCFIERAPKQPSFTEAIRQAEKLLAAALNRR